MQAPKWSFSRWGGPHEGSAPALGAGTMTMPLANGADVGVRGG